MGQGAIVGLTSVTAPSCCLSPHPPGVWPALLVLVTPSNPAPSSPVMCMFLTSLHQSSCLGWEEGEAPSLRECGRKGAALFVTVFFVLSQLGRHGDRGGVHPYSPVLSSSNPSNFVSSPPLPSIEEPLRMSQL